MGTLIPEAPRDQVESSFTAILRKLFVAEPDVRALVFVDSDGECVDYCSALDPFEAKVAGAQMQVVMQNMRVRLLEMMTGEPIALEIFCDKRDIVARRIDDDYLLVALVRGGMTDATVLSGIEETVRRLRREIGLLPPFWDPGGGPLEVKVRMAVGWEFAPVAVEQMGEETPIKDVLGRWEEDGGAPGGQLVCFRVRTETEVELTLAYDPTQERWFRW